MGKGKGLLLAAALFVTGAIVGVLGMEAWHAMRGGPFGKMERLGPAGFILEHMARELNLTAEQRAQIRPVIEEMVARIEETRKPFLEKEEAILDEYHKKMKAFLTPEQSSKQDELLARVRRFQGRMMPPPPPPPPGHGLFGPPPGPPPGPEPR